MKKRILVLLSVVALMVVMLAMSVAPAFAAWDPMTGCRTGDLLIEADRFPPEIASANGKRSVDPFICVSPSPNGRLHVYDNRPVTIP